MRIHKAIYILILSGVLASSAFATTYYVDFVGGADTNAGTSTGAAWQHVKGMTGCASVCTSTALADGDVITFKGGVTWTSSYPWAFSGGTAAAITYTTDHTWFTGGAFAQPLFDDQGAHPGAVGMANKTGGGFVTLNDLHFANCGVTYTAVAGSPGANSDKCLVFSHTHDITITNSTFTTESWIGLYFVFDAAGSYSNFTITGNDFSHVNGAMWFASAQANTTMHTLYYVNNTFHDFHSQIGNGLHSDGAFHHFSTPTADATQFADGVTFCNNRFYGDFTISNGANGFTAMFFSENSLSGTVCNNDVSFSPALPTNQGEAIWDFGTNSNTHAATLNVFNNTASMAGSSASAISDCISEYDLSHTTTTLENNICSGMQYIVGGGGTVSGTWDYNLWNTSGGQVSVSQTYAQWQGAGRDAHGVLGGDPLFVSSPGNEQLQSSSPAKGAGLNLTSLAIIVLNSDILGNARPGSAAWDIGAYSSTVVTPAPALGMFAELNHK